MSRVLLIALCGVRIQTTHIMFSLDVAQYLLTIFKETNASTFLIVTRYLRRMKVNLGYQILTPIFNSLGPSFVQIPKSILLGWDFKEYTGPRR